METGHIYLVQRTFNGFGFKAIFDNSQKIGGEKKRFRFPPSFGPSKKKIVYFIFPDTLKMSKENSKNRV